MPLALCPITPLPRAMVRCMKNQRWELLFAFWPFFALIVGLLLPLILNLLNWIR